MSERKRSIAFIAAMVIAVAVPLGVAATDAFTDVPDSNVHHDDIKWLKDAGVTLGCNPPTNTEFCPGDPVLRQQMASFMRRLAENQVVDAATAVVAGTAYEATRDGIVDITGTSSTDNTSIATLSDLPAGAYVVTASWNANAHGVGASARVACVVSAGTGQARAIAHVENPGAGQESMAATLTGEIAEGETINLSCWRENASGDHSASSIHLVAHRVGSVVSTEVTG